jgi:hypothetical protein
LPESRGVPSDILKIRWTHLEEKRVEKILLARHERQKVVQEEKQGKIVYDYEEG